MERDKYSPKAKDEPPAPVHPPVAPMPPLPELYNPRVAELQRKKAALGEHLTRMPRVGERVWLTIPYERFDFGKLLYIHRKDDVGIVVCRPSGCVDVIFRNRY